MILEPGYYRRKVYAEANVKWEPLLVPVYQPMQTTLKGMVKVAVDGNQPGDPKKAWPLEKKPHLDFLWAQTASSSLKTNACPL